MDSDNVSYVISRGQYSILVVDDNPENIAVLSKILIQNGYGVRAAKNGKEALDSVKAKAPDLILLDVKMPGMTGFEVSQNLRNDASFSKIPVIFISALSETTDKVKAFEVGGKDYITKPFQAEEVLARVKTHIDLYQYQQQLEHVNIDQFNQLQSLFDHAAIPIWEEDYSLVKKRLDQLQDQGIANLEKHLINHSDEVKHLATLIKVRKRNQKALEILGLQSKPENNQSITNYFTQNSFEVLRNEIIALARGSNNFKNEISIRKQKGEIKYFQLSLALLPDIESQWDRVFLSLIDISERRVAQIKIEELSRQLESENKILKEAQKLAQIGNWELNLETNELYWSDEIFRIFAIDSKLFDATYEAFIEAIHPDDRIVVDKAYQKHLIDKNPYHIEHRLLMPNGGIKYVVEECNSTFSEDGKALSSRGTVQDITDRVKAQIELENSERKFKSITERIHDVIILSDLQGKINYVSPSVLRVFGYDPEDMVDNNIFDFLPDSEIAGIENSFNDVNSGKIINERQFSMRKKDGSQAFTTFSAVPIVENGSIIGGQAILRDITETKLAQESVVRLSKVIEQSPMIVLITDKDGLLLYANPVFASITGYDPKDLIGRKPTQIKSGYHDNEFYKELWDTILAGQIWEGEFCNRRKSGELFWEKAIISPILGAHGEILNFVAIKEDITEKKKTQVDLQIATEKAEESDRLKSAFLASMSHEIRTPLNAIVGFSNIISEESNMPELKEYAKTINQQNKLMLGLIDDIINYAKIEAGSFEISKREFEVNQLLEDIYALFKDKMPQTTELKPILFSDSISAFSDPPRITAVFSHLLSNSIKFTKEGSISFGIKKDTQSEIIFFVSDTGIGIALEDQETVFERFKKIDLFSQGVGLGLSIVSSIINLMNGEIWLESAPGRGTTFYFKIPMIEQ